MPQLTAASVPDASSFSFDLQVQLYSLDNYTNRAIDWFSLAKTGTGGALIFSPFDGRSG